MNYDTHQRILRQQRQGEFALRVSYVLMIITSLVWTLVWVVDHVRKAVDNAL